jgi:hypothetical protein
MVAGGLAISQGKAFAIDSLLSQRSAATRRLFPMPPALAHLCFRRRPLGYKSASGQSKQEGKEPNQA